MLKSNMLRMMQMMESLLEGNAIDTTVNSIFGGTTLLAQSSSEKTVDGWKIRTVEAVTTDGRMHTYTSEIKTDGTERKYHEKTVTVTVEDLEKMEADAVAAKDYRRAQAIKEVIDARKKK